MDMSNFRPELHVAQQSRRGKLRIQPDSNPTHNQFGVYVNNLDQLPADNGPNYESSNLPNGRPGNICYDPSQYCSQMLNFSSSSQNLMVGERVGEAPTENYSRTMVSSDHDAQYFSAWKSIGSQSSSDNWVANQSPIFVGEGLSGSSLNIINRTPISTLDVKPYNIGYPELHSSEISINPNIHKQYGDMNRSSYAIQEFVTSSNVPSFGLELAQKSSEGTSHGPWVVGGGELALLPAYADQLGVRGHSDLITRPVEGCHWSGEFDHRDLRTAANDNSNTQTLSLSLSSVPSPKVHASQVAERDPNPSKILGNATRSLIHRNPGPLGPFTGYATILRSSKFLRPAQQLLEELCFVARPKRVEISDKTLEEVRVSSGVVSDGEPAVRAVGGDSSGSSLAFNGPNDKGRDARGTSCSMDSYRPENLQRKAKLLCMQDEVCKRYKQYHQQMQMVVSSFESVAGLSTATPYVSLALTMVSKHFQCLKNAITDQLKNIRNALGEDLSSLSAGTSCSKGDGNVSMLKFFDQSFEKQKSSSGLGILEGQHVWRPQRGLPERAVSILRAWLFDHFLHPYPTDTDKHMLATQTGLTRNQVSNWFINARVRVWKPMVEEIHMLETKGTAETRSDPTGETTNKTATGGYHQANDNAQSFNALNMDKEVECSRVGPSETHDFDRSNPNIWNQEKRSRIECHDPSMLNGSLMGLVPSHHSNIEIGGLGPVSLTLGLRQSAENGQRHFGGQIIRDFVG